MSKRICGIFPQFVEKLGPVRGDFYGRGQRFLD